MPTDLERLVVSLSADIKAFERGLAKAQGATVRSTKAIQANFTKMNRGLTAEFASFGRTAVAAFAGIAAAQGLKNFSDAATRIDNALKVAGLSGEALDKVYQRLFESAQKNAAPIESLVTLYGRAAAVQAELGVTTEELLGFTDKVALALRVAGTDAQTASGALLQLSQALGSSRIQAEEFNSINEGARPILQAVAAGIKEAGGSVSKLKQLVNDGKVSNQAFFRGFEAGAVTLETRVAGATLTVDQAFGNLQTSLIDLFRGFNKATGAGEKFANGIDNLSKRISQLDVSGLLEKLASVKKGIDDAANSFGNSDFINGLARLMGVTDEQGNIINPDVKEAQTKIASLESEIKLLQERISVNTQLGFSNTEAFERIRELRLSLASLRSEAANLAPTVAGIKPDGTPIPAGLTNGTMGGSTIRGGARRVAPVETVTLKDFPVPGSKTGGGGSQKQNEYDQAIKAANDQTKALQQQEAALRGLDGASADYAAKVAAVEKAQELLTAAQEGGKAVGKELSDVNQLLNGDLSRLSPEAQKQALAIRNLSLSYADATVNVDKLKEAQTKAADAAREAIQFQKDLVNGALSDMRTALEDGKLTWEDLGTVAVNVLNKIADRLQTMLVDQLFSKGLGGLFGSVGGLGSIIGGGGGSNYFPPAPVTGAMAAPTMPSPSAMRAASGGMVDVRVSVDDEGAIKAYVEREGRRTEARVATASQAGLAAYARGQGKSNARDAVRRPRRVN